MALQHGTKGQLREPSKKDVAICVPCKHHHCQVYSPTDTIVLDVAHSVHMNQLVCQLVVQVVVAKANSVYLNVFV